MTYGIRISIDGVPVATSLADDNPAAPTAIDELKVVWGRDSIYEQPDPSQATLTLLDRTGRYVDGATLTSKRLEAYITGEAAGDRRVFRGTITNPTCERITLDGDSAYKVTIVAADPMADLGRYVGPGDWYPPFQSDWGSMTLANGAYITEGGRERVDNLFNQGTATRYLPTDVPRIISGIDYPPAFAPGHEGQPSYFLYAGAIEGGTASVLDVMREVSRIEPLGWVNYDPAIDWLRIGGLAPAAGLRLALSAGRIVVVPASQPAGASGPLLILDASTIEVPEGYKLTAAPDNAIDRIILPRLRQIYTQDGPPINGVQFYKMIMVRSQGWRTANRYNPSQFGMRQLDYGLFAGGLENDFASPPYDYGSDGVGWLLDTVKAYVDSYNGSYRLPRLRYSVKRDPAVTDNRTEMLINTRAHARAVYFSGSVFNGLAGVPAQVQIIGGTTGYSAGSWWAELETAPANTAGLAASTLTLAQLVTNPGPTIADFDPSIRLADFGLIQTGLN